MTAHSDTSEEEWPEVYSKWIDVNYIIKNITRVPDNLNEFDDRFVDINYYKDLLFKYTKPCDISPLDSILTPKVFISNNSTGMSKTASYLQTFNLKKSLHEYETIAAIKEKENKENRRLQEELKELTETDYEVNSVSANYYKNIDRLALVIGDILEINNQDNPSLYEQVILALLGHLIYAEQEIKKNEKFILFLKAVKSVLNKVSKRFQINKREFIRKITSLDFKNLDDTHSFALISLRY